MRGGEIFNFEVGLVEEGLEGVDLSVSAGSFSTSDGSKCWIAWSDAATTGVGALVASLEGMFISGGIVSLVGEVDVGEEDFEFGGTSGASGCGEAILVVGWILG